MIVNSLISYLESVSAITDLLAPHVSIRGKHGIYAQKIPQESALPCLWLDINSNDLSYHQLGQTNLSNPQIELRIHALTYSALDAIREQLRLYLSGFSGDMSGTNVQGIYLAALPDTWFKSDSDDDMGTHTGGWRLNCFHDEPLPAV